MAIKVVEKTSGDKIPYRVTSKGVIYFGDDDLSIKLPNYERDDEVNIDICMNAYNMLVMGQGVRYVAQISIPPRVYTESIVESDDSSMETSDSEFGGMSRVKTIREPVPFDIDKCTLYLWGIEDEEEVPAFSGDFNMAEEVHSAENEMEE